MGYVTKLEVGGKDFEIVSLTRAQTRELEAREREMRRRPEPVESRIVDGQVPVTGDEPESLMDALLGLAYPDEDFETMANRDVVQVFKETHAYTYGAPVPEKNS